MEKESFKIFKVITLDIRSEKWHDFSSELAAWFCNEEDAVSCVVNNVADIQDHTYNYVLISSSEEGCYGLNDEELYWFKWNKENKKWVQIYDRPKACEQLHIIG